MLTVSATRLFGFHTLYAKWSIHIIQQYIRHHVCSRDKAWSLGRCFKLMLNTWHLAKCPSASSSLFCDQSINLRSRREAIIRSSAP